MGSRLKPHEPLHQTLAEALDPFCTLEARERIFTRAARNLESDLIPTDVFSFCDYVRGPLSLATTEVLGEDVTEQVRQHLAPILMTASSGIGEVEPQDTSLALILHADGPVREFVVQILVDAGFEVEVAEDAMQANAIIAQKHPAVFLVESELSGMTASQVAAMVRRAYGEQSPAFVMVPSEGDFEPAELLSAIDHSLEDPPTDA